MSSCEVYEVYNIVTDYVFPLFGLLVSRFSLTHFGREVSLDADHKRRTGGRRDSKGTNVYVSLVSGRRRGRGHF